MYRVSMVEAFRQWEADDSADDADLLKRLRGVDSRSAAMAAGTAFHKALELASDGIVVSHLEADGHRFEFVGDFLMELAEIREMRASKVYMVDGEPIEISGQVDAIDGARIEDHKTTKAFDAERYAEGYQWRLYLEIFGANHFRWNVFIITAKGKKHPLVYRVKEAHRLEQFRYPGMEADCQALVERFARFVRERL